MFWIFITLALTTAVLVLDTARRLRNLATQPQPVPVRAS